MFNRSRGKPSSDSEDVLARKHAQSSFSVGEKLHAPGTTATPNAQPLQPTSPQQILYMQRTIGNAAVQRLLNPTAITPEETMPPHAPGCACPSCSSHMKTVSDEEPHAPALQREEEEEPEQEAESYAETSDNAAEDYSPVSEPDSETETGDDALAETSVTMSVQEEVVPFDMGVMPDQGLQLADAGGGGQAEVVEETAVAAPALGGFTALGQVGTAPVNVTEQMPDDHVPHAFTNGGQTGTVAWAGGGGAGPRGNENTGSIQTEVPPTFSSGPDPATPGAFIAWIDANTGRADVTRSYLGAITGNQSNGQYVSAAAATRFNAHEQLHVASTQGFYNTHIAPMLLLIAARYPGGTTTPGATAAAAIAALQATINWATNIAAFKTNDTAANRSSGPMGPVDTNDLNSGTYPENRGPGTIAGTAYTNRVATPGEVLPTT